MSQQVCQGGYGATCHRGLLYLAVVSLKSRALFSTCAALPSEVLETGSACYWLIWGVSLPPHLSITGSVHRRQDRTSFWGCSFSSSAFLDSYMGCSFWIWKLLLAFGHSHKVASENSLGTVKLKLCEAEPRLLLRGHLLHSAIMALTEHIPVPG